MLPVTYDVSIPQSEPFLKEAAEQKWQEQTLKKQERFPYLRKSPKAVSYTHLSQKPRPRGAGEQRPLFSRDRPLYGGRRRRRVGVQIIPPPGGPLRRGAAAHRSDHHGENPGVAQGLNEIQAWRTGKKEKAHLSLIHI